MNNLYARAVFFTKDAGRSLRFYTEQLGFSVDWRDSDADPPYVFQVSLLGFELIINQTSEQTRQRAGHGRVYIGLEDDQIDPVLKHIAARGIQTERIEWGRPTLVVRDVDQNELFFWDWPEKQPTAGEPSDVAE
jgi:catechol 2,3-dioxygenase-like lactoylglutathione lyase family enzyme